MSSEFFNCSAEVRQRENLSPFLFSLRPREAFLKKCISGLDSISKDIEDNLCAFMKLFTFFYADDTTYVHVYK